LRFGSIPFAFKGESISNGMLHLQFYPVNKYRIFLKGAYGISEYTNLRPDKYHGNLKFLVDGIVDGFCNAHVIR